MFIIKTQTSKHNDSKYYTTKLVENFRTPTNKVKRRTLLNLGQGYSGVAESEWQELTTCIEDVLSGAMPLFAMPAHIEAEAKRIADLLGLSTLPKLIRHFPRVQYLYGFSPYLNLNTFTFRFQTGVLTKFKVIGISPN